MQNVNHQWQAKSANSSPKNADPGSKKSAQEWAGVSVPPRTAGCGVRLVVFDLDDTLYPEAEYVLSGFQAVAEWAQTQFAVAADVAFEELSRLFRAGVRGDTFNRWLGGRGIDATRWVPEMVAVYREHQPVLRPFPGIESLVHSLARDVRVGLISDGHYRVQERKFHALDLGCHFSAVVFTDRLGRDAWKPSPQAFHLMLEELAVQPGEALYVADNPAKDFRAARAAGVGSVRFRHRLGLCRAAKPASPEDAADCEVTSVMELRTLLLGSPASET